MLMNHDHCKREKATAYAFSPGLDCKNLGSFEQQSAATDSSCVKARIKVLNLDMCWVPPGLTVSTKALHSWLFGPASGVILASFSYLRSHPCLTKGLLSGSPSAMFLFFKFPPRHYIPFTVKQTLLSVGLWPNVLSNKRDLVKISDALLLWTSNLLVGWTMLLLCLVKLSCGSDIVAPTPPPTPNIKWMGFSVSHCDRPLVGDSRPSTEAWFALLMSKSDAHRHNLVHCWFKHCGFDPPWTLSCLIWLICLVDCSRSRSRKSMYKAFSMYLRKLSGMEVVARKRSGVVFGGTVTQSHTFYAFVVDCLNVSLGSPSLLVITKFGSSDIRRRGLESISTNGKCPETWKTIVCVMFLLRHVVKGLHPDIELWLCYKISVRFVNLQIIE